MGLASADFVDGRWTFADESQIEIGIFGCFYAYTKDGNTIRGGDGRSLRCATFADAMIALALKDCGPLAIRK